MHPRFLSLAVLLTALAVCEPVWAQVTVNPGALDQLGGAPAAASPAPAHPPPPRRPAETRPPAHHAAAPPAHPATHPATVAATPAPAKPKPPVVPPAPPPEAVLKPLDPPPPAHPAAPPPPPPVVADAPGAAAPIPQGVRLTFGPDRADLNAETDQVVQELAHRSPTGIFNITAYAPGTADDPSTPRRLSLSRALAVRSALINAGVPSTRIYAHAMGPNFTDGPPDRVDLTATEPAVTPSAAAPAPPAPAPSAAK